MVYLERQPALNCLLTSAQSAALDEVVCAARVFVQRQELEAAEELEGGQMQSQQRTLDSACLRFCISLLDHRLMGDIYDSVVIGFLAVLGIDTAREGFQEVTTYARVVWLDQDFSDARSTAGSDCSRRRRDRISSIDDRDYARSFYGVW
jgi:hypothetical protein